MGLPDIISRYCVPVTEWTIVALALHRNFSGGKTNPAAGGLVFVLTAVIVAGTNAIPLRCPFLKTTLVIAGLIMAIRFIYKAPLFVAVFFCVAVMYIDTMSDLVMENLFVSLTAGDLELIPREDTWARLALSGASKALQGGITLVLVVGFGKISWHVPRIYWGMLNAILALYFVLVLAASTFNPRPNMIFDSRLIALMAGIFLVTNLLPVVLFARMSNHYIQSQIKYTTRITQSKMKDEILLSEKENAARGQARHEFKNTMHNIAHLIINGRSEDALWFIAGYTSSLPETRLSRYTGIGAVDSMISMKEAEARAHGIAITIDAQEVPAETAPVIDACSILSNLLDNAIEANSEVPPGKRVISLDIYVHGDTLNIITSNTYRKEPLCVNNRFITSKPDIDAHGYGTVIVREICEHHDGQFLIEYSDGTFVAHAVLLLTLPGS